MEVIIRITLMAGNIRRDHEINLKVRGILYYGCIAHTQVPLVSVKKIDKVNVIIFIIVNSVVCFILGLSLILR